MTKRVVIAITGASGSIYGIRLLQVMAGLSFVETHLVLTTAARTTLSYETDYGLPEVKALADVVHHDRDIGASIASGSFRTDGMVVVPCSIKTLSAIAHCYGASLVARAADVTLKERRRLVLVVRETPLHLGHLRLMTEVTEAGAVVVPPMPAFYHRPKSLFEIIDQTVMKILDLLGLEVEIAPRWHGTTCTGTPVAETPREAPGER